METSLIIFVLAVAVAVAVYSFEGFINALKEIFGEENEEANPVKEETESKEVEV
jgi:cytochrome b